VVAWKRGGNSCRAADPFEGLDERGWRWIPARKPKLVEGKPKFDQPETEAVVEKMLELADL